EMDRCAGPVPQLQVTGDEVGVEVRQEHMLDLKPVLGGERQVLIDVALRIDDGRDLRLLVSDEIRRVRKAIQVELLEDHSGIIMPRRTGGFGWRSTHAENFSASGRRSPAHTASAAGPA